MVNAYSKGIGNDGTKTIGEDNLGRLATMPAEQRKEICRKGGLANKGLKKPMYTKCIKCELKDTCERAYEEAKKMHNIGIEAEQNGNPQHINIDKCKCFDIKMSRCAYELEHAGELKGKVLRSFRAFTSADPNDLLKKIHIIFCKLEGQVELDPSFAKYAQLYYMLTNLYKIKYGNSGVSNVSINNTIAGESKGATIDIKMMMSQIRKEQSSIETVAPADVIEQAETGQSKEDSSDEEEE